MTNSQTALEYVTDQMEQGKITAAQANVLKVQIEGFTVVHKLPASVRKALNEAVKNGELGHLKRGGLKPEIYHHKNARGKAIEEQNKIARESVESLKKCFAL